jgi:hypothetical protein
MPMAFAMKKIRALEPTTRVVFAMVRELFMIAAVLTFLMAIAIVTGTKWTPLVSVEDRVARISTMMVSVMT